MTDHAGQSVAPTSRRIATAPTGDPNDLVLTLPAAHWARQGCLRFDVVIDGEVIVESDLVAGFMHRGAEKLFEARDYRQGLALANRHDWLAPACGELLMARAAEDLLGITVPDLARWLRVLIVELSRQSALLLLIGTAVVSPSDPADPEVEQQARDAREQLLALIEQLTGARMHVTFTTIGGVRSAPTVEWIDRVVAASTAIAESTAPMLRAAVASVSAQFDGLGTVTGDAALAAGASGVVAKAAGVDRDARRGDPDYTDVVELLPRVETAERGDAATRLALMVTELEAACALTCAAAERVIALLGSSISAPMPKSLRVPVGTSVQWLETPLGTTGGLLESRGDRAPHRWALRTPSAAHAPVLANSLVGHSVDDVAAIVSSFPIVIGDLDR